MADTDPDTTEVPRGPLVAHVVAEALEHGEICYEPEPEDAHEPPSWSLADVGRWEVNSNGAGPGTVTLTGRTEASYQVQTSAAKRNPPGEAHPAEYRTEMLELVVVITADWRAMNGLGEYTIEAEVA